MYNIAEQLRTAQKTNLDIFLQFAGIAVEGAEKLVELKLKTARGLFADAVKHAEAMSAAKNAQEITELHTALVQPAIDKVTDYGRNVHAMMTQIQVELNKVFEERVSDLNKNVQSVLDEAEEGAPAGSDIAVAAVKSAIIAASQAYGAFARTTKQVAEASAAATTVAASKNKNNGRSRNQSA